MSHKFAWGYVGKDICRRCLTPSHLFVYSGFADTVNAQEVKCESCLSHQIERFVSFNNLDEEFRAQLLYDVEERPSTLPEVFPIIQHTPTCDVCEIIEGEEHWRFVSAEINTEHEGVTKTVTVHARCKTTCPDCETALATPVNRNYRSEWRIPYGSFITTERVDGDVRCLPCSKKYQESQGGTDEFFYCECCEAEWHHSYSIYYLGERYCESCHDDNAYRCEDCGDDCWSGDDHYCDASDDDDYEDSPIHNYSYRPSLNFFGEGKYHLGFELEVEVRSNASRHEGAELAQDVFGGRVYLKEDGSLNNGFEIVTHPHTLSEYQKEFNWAGLDKIKRSGIRSWNTSTCGLHVHVSRTAFDPVRIPNMSIEQRILKRQAHELRFMKLIYDNERQVGRIAGRSANHYAGFQDKGKLVRKVKQGFQANGRYSAVNTENDATLEVRVFKGSLRPERVLSALEFVTASVEYTRDLPINGKNNALSWLRFTGYVAEYAETYPNLALIMNESFNSDYPLSED